MVDDICAVVFHWNKWYMIPVKMSSEFFDLTGGLSSLKRGESGLVMKTDLLENWLAIG